MADRLEDELAELADRTGMASVDPDRLWQRGRRRRRRKRVAGGVVAGLLVVGVGAPAVGQLVEAARPSATVVVSQPGGGAVAPACVPAVALRVPGPTVTRAEASVALVSVLEEVGYDLPSGPDRFRDDDGRAEEPAIDRLAAAGLVRGRSADTTEFAPDAALTRGQLATLVVRAHELATGRALPAAEDRFMDDDALPHAADLDRAWAAGAISETGDATVSPRAAATRAEVDGSLARLAALVRGSEPSTCRTRSPG